MKFFLQKLNHYSKLELFHLIKLKIGEKLIFSVPRGLKQTFFYLNTPFFKKIKKIKKKDGLILEFDINNQKKLAFIKKNSSDLLVFVQIIKNREYQGIADLFVKKNIRIKTMIDAGANIGLTSVFFKALFPELKIIMLEPNIKTYNRLLFNIKLNNLKNIFPSNEGLWGKNTFLSPSTGFRDSLDWSFSLKESQNISENVIKVLSMKDIINRHNLKEIDFLKIDIEGGELSLFSDKEIDFWSKNIKVIAVEIHDELKCKKMIVATLKRLDFKIIYVGELTVGINRRKF